MPYPSTNVLDPLNGYLTYGIYTFNPVAWGSVGSFAEPLGSGSFSVKDAVAATTSAYWNQNLNSYDQEVFITLTTIPASGYIDVQARLNDPTITTYNAYQWEYNISPVRLRFYRVIGGVLTTLLTDTTHTMVSGDSLGLRVYGSDAGVYLEGWITISGVWTLVDTFVDTNANRILVGNYLNFDAGTAGNWRLNNFGGGVINSFKDAYSYPPRGYGAGW